jgi:CrcB protein
MSATSVDPDLPARTDPAAHRQPMLLLLVLLGGMVGAPARYLIGTALPTAAQGFPLATFLVNVSGSFALGLLLEGLARRGAETAGRREVRLAVGTGLLGAFTTYSALATEVALLMRDDRGGLALIYALGSVVAGLVAAGAGIAAGQFMGARQR